MRWKINGESDEKKVIEGGRGVEEGVVTTRDSGGRAGKDNKRRIKHHNINCYRAAFMRSSTSTYCIGNAQRCHRAPSISARSYHIIKE